MGGYLGHRARVKMGKVKKQRFHQPLSQQILGEELVKKSKRIKAKKPPVQEKDYVEERLSKRILNEVKRQQEELEEEHGITFLKRPEASRKVSKLSSDVLSSSEGEDEECGQEEEHDLCPVVREEDEEALKLFMSSEMPQRRTLADIIMEKIQEKQTEIGTAQSSIVADSQLDKKVVSVFRSVGQILSKYRAGKLPKAFKVIPTLSNWEEILYITDPDKWSASAMLQATRIFSSNLNVAKAQRFYNLVLLPRIRDDILEYKRLNYHLYMALKKALFKPAAFFKGLLIPLCESGTCTLREAVIVASVLAKTSIPVLHSSAALLKIAEMEYSGANSIFLRTLLDKKYALPYRVLDAVTFHFLKFQHDSRKLPVLWHQSLLTFVQRYKEDISLEQKEALLELIRVKEHQDITPEIRHEIVHSRCRDIDDIYLNKSKIIVSEKMN